MNDNDKNQLNIFSGKDDHGNRAKYDHETGKENKGHEDCNDAAECLISERNEYIRILSTKIKTRNDD